MIFPCPKGCKSDFQDGLYGKGRRVFNQSKGPVASLLYGRCSVCKEEQVVGHKATDKEEVADSGNQSQAA
jgi:hypothetical protein